MEQFKYGEEVLVRNDEREDWSKRVYVGTLPNCDRHWAMSISQHPGNFDGLPWPWRQIRKIQKPEPALIDIEQTETIEQRMDKFEAVFNGAVKHINEQLESIKTQLK